MSGGGSSGDAGSDSQEATAPQDYETNYSEYQGGPAYDFDDTTTGATSTTSTTSSSNDNVHFSRKTTFNSQRLQFCC